MRHSHSVNRRISLSTSRSVSRSTRFLTSTSTSSSSLSSLSTSSSSYATTSSSEPAKDVLHPDRKQYWKRTLSLSKANLTIGCAVFGAVKRYKHTVIFFHGTPGSRLDAAYLNEAAKRLEIRILAFDRPGMGLSTYVKKREIPDFADNIKELLDVHFRNPEVHLFGYSNGSAYALATSAVLPRSQLKGMCIVAGLPPWSIAKEEMAASKRRVAKIVKTAPDFLAPAGDLLLGKAARSDNPASFDRIMTMWIKTLNNARQDLYKDKKVKRTFFEAKRAAYRQPKGIIRDVVLLTSDWQLDLKKVAKRKIKMFYASEDVVTPPRAGKRFAKLLPDAEVEIIEGEDHQSILARQGGYILKRLVGKERDRSRSRN